jgi:DNA polymerase sigma
MNISDARLMTLCSYGWSLLVIHFLQSKVGLIPNLQQVNNLKSFKKEEEAALDSGNPSNSNSKIIQVRKRSDPTQLTDIDISFLLENDNDYKQLLLRTPDDQNTLSRTFLKFLYYSSWTLNANNVGISINRGGQIPRGEFPKWFNNDVMVIQDPIEPERNIGRSVSHTGWHLIKGTGMHTIHTVQHLQSFQFFLDKH